MSSRKDQKASARERAAELRAAQARAERRRVLLAVGAVAVVVVVLVGLVAVKLAGGGSPAPAAASSVASPAVVQAVTGVPAATLDKVGTGTAQGGPQAIDAPAMTASGKPRVLYVGAEYCPYCAAERWPVVVALSRFGTFTHLGATHSASADIFPSTATLSFHGASYASKYLSFTGLETSSNKPSGSGYAPLDTPTKADQALFSKYDAPPYVTSQAGSIPFIDIAGRYISAGSTYDPGLLKGMTHQQIADALKNPDSAVAKAVDGSANLFTAAICKATGGDPGNVCTASGVTAAAAKLGKG